MGARIQITIDCADPARLADFWAAALEYRLMDPPEGSSTWEEWLEAMGVPREEWDPGRPYNKIVDPDGHRPPIWFQRVPEPKVVKNRLHMDIDASDPAAPRERRKEQIDAEVDRLVGLGATRIHAFDEAGDHDWVVMQDPEGNEFCLR